MKRLLSLLGSIALVASTSGLVVACGTTSVDRWSTPVLDEDIYNKILLQMQGDSDLSDLKLGNIFDDIADKKAAVLDMINDKISKLYYNQEQNNLFSRLGMNKIEKNKDANGNTVDNELDAKIDEMSNTIATNSFYSTYTASLIDDTTAPMDETISGNTEDGGYILNPSKLMQNDEDVKYTVWFGANGGSSLKQWYTASEKINGDGFTDSIPTIEELETNDFYVVANAADTDTISVPTTTFTTDTDASTETIDGAALKVNGESAMSGKTALQYRFQNYFATKIKSANYSNIFSMSYLDSQMWRSIGSNGLYINQASDVVKKVQNWDQKSGYKSNIKMVWSFTMDESNQSSVYDSFKSLINADGTLKDSSSTTLKAIFEAMNTASANQSKAGSDPYFGISGFNGFVQNDGTSIKSAEGSLIASSDSYTKIANANGPAIITSNKSTGFKSSETNKKDYYLVLPLYMIDLLNDKSGSFNNGESTTINLDATGNITNDLSANKLADVQSGITNIANNSAWRIVINGVAKTLSEVQSQYSGWTGVKDLTDDQVFDGTTINSAFSSNTPSGVTFDGLVGSTKNTHDNTYGNIALDKDVKISATNITSSVDGVTVVSSNANGSVVHVDSSKFSYGDVITIDGGIKLSLDNGSTNLITVNGTTTANNTTKAFNINLGSGTSNPDSLINNGDFHYYNNNISSTDVSDATGTVKTDLLRELQYITSKDDSTIEAAKTAVYPQFLSSDDVLYQALYDDISNYLKDDILENGTTD